MILSRIGKSSMGFLKRLPSCIRHYWKLRVNSLESYPSRSKERKGNRRGNGRIIQLDYKTESSQGKF